MVTTASAPAALEIDEVWRRYKLDPTSKEYRNLLVEHYLPLVKYNGERIWARLPEGVELDDLISAGVFGLMSAREAGSSEKVRARCWWGARPSRFARRASSSPQGSSRLITAQPSSARYSGENSLALASKLRPGRSGSIPSTGT